jgi:hypothetical protein
MMPSTLEKLWKQTLFTCRNYRNSNYLEEVFTIKGSNIFNQDKIRAQAKGHGEEAVDGRGLGVYHVA